MARTAIPISQLAGNSGVVPSATAIDVTNGMTIANSFSERTILVITNTDTSPHVVTVVASDPVLGLGTWPNSVYSVQASSTAYVGPFESGRVQQKDGSVSLNFVTGHTGTVTALQMPRGI